MSRITETLCDICFVKAGFIDYERNMTYKEAIQKSWKNIFDDFPIYDERYRSVLCQKILAHYFTREISAETVGLWVFWLNTKMNEIMPYYNELYKSALLEFNPLYDTDLTRDYNRKNVSNEKTKNKNTSKENGVSNTDSTVNNTGNFNETDNDTLKKEDAFSQTPQGGLNGIENMNYLTEGRIIKDTNKYTKTGSNTDKNIVDSTETFDNSKTDDFNGDKNLNSVDEYIEHIKGKSGGKSFSEMIMEFRKVLINIDLLVINELDELFLRVW